MKDTNYTNEFITGFPPGTLQSIQELHNLHYSSLLYFTERIIRDRMVAREIVVETFIKLLNRRQYFPNLPDIKAFLYITSRNACMDYLRVAKNDRPLPEAPISFIESDMDLTDESSIAEAGRALWSAIGNMAPLYQQVFRLLFVEGMQTAAASRALEIDQREILVCRKKILYQLQTALSEIQLYSTPFFIHFLTVDCRKNAPASNIPVPANR